MKVYEIAECEEYAFQISRGLYKDKAKAVAIAQELCKKSLTGRDRDEPNASVVEVGPGETFVLAGLWDKTTFDEFIFREGWGFWWYAPPFNHEGAFGIFEREVIE